MSTLTLEFTKLALSKKRRRWQLYFVMVTEHPDDNDKMLVSSFPDPYIRLKPNQDNVISFEPEGGPGADGLFVLERPLPADNRIKTRLYLFQSRKELRHLGEALTDLQSTLGGDAFEIVTDALGTSVPWLVIAKRAVPMVGNILCDIKDRNMGFVSLDESFDEISETNSCLVRANGFSTGEAKLWWKWKLHK
ncbi:hypothetical protein [Mangrovibacterium diazotrophicum]|uniref:Uncharacterized protein n=1 Tax=Mangrovibacterium diazotrophicum TaxID=1261403 RepID=A0A419W650_9BACT|nr:hypothetical protein [Mangrovibacterium diazotrophicum]RKD90924.1 hypothetical protein BC643_1269 [Mangrovibacterium diazotrophicum]